MSESWWRDDAVAWSGGDWSLELRGDELAEIRHRGTMLVRGVRAAVRDSGWRTVPVVVKSVETSSESLTLALTHEGFGALLSSTMSVHAHGDELTVRWDATNEAAFDTCRAGLVVLHPATDAGRTMTVTHTDGTTVSTAFPLEISPHQPIVDIRELDLGGVVLAFDGEVFEMEDQRNWSDASFKTYSRPLALPYPYRLHAGEQIRQSLRIRATGGRADAATRDSDTIALRVAGPFPAIGIEASTAPDPVTLSTTGTFRVVELDLTTLAWPAALARAVADGVPLDVRWVTSGSAQELTGAASALSGIDVLRVTPFDSADHITTSLLLDATREALAGAAAQVPVVAGARSHFTELNREQHRIPGDVDGIAVNTTPLFHSLDTEQLVEAVAMQRLIAEQAVRIAGGVPVHVGPVSLRPRFNNVATSPEPRPTRADLSQGYGAEFTGGVDERQRSPELGAWVIASAAALAVPGVASLSWFETTGPRGIDGTAAADAITALASLNGGELLTGSSPDGLLWALGSQRDGVTTVIAANLDRIERTIEVSADSALSGLTLAAGCWAPITLRVTATS